MVDELEDVLDTKGDLVSLIVLYIDQEIILEGEFLAEAVLVFDIDELPERVGLEDAVFDSLDDWLYVDVRNGVFVKNIDKLINDVLVPVVDSVEI